MKGVKHSSYLWVADNNWINFAEKWMCFDALVADWQSAGFSPIYHSPFICCCQTFPQPPFQGRLIKQLFNKTKRHLHSRRTEQGFTAQRGESWDEYKLTQWHAVFFFSFFLLPRDEKFDTVSRRLGWLCLLLSDVSAEQWLTRPQPLCRLADLLLVSRKRLDLAGLDFSAGRLPRAALFAAAEFTPLLQGLCWFACLLHFANIA